QVMPTGGHPAVVARNRHLPGRPTVLLYGHYDLHPPDALDLLPTDQFVPVVRRDESGYNAIFARGAVDDKGQVWCHVEALAAWQAHGGVPVNLICLIEGEEEVGSENLENFVRTNRDLLKSDICIISDTGLLQRGIPAICYGLRGLVYEEVRVEGPSHDLHSGGYGGAIRNPANVLVDLLASLHNPDGTVNIPGFYDDVAPLSPAEREQWQRLPHNDAEWAAAIGLGESDLSGETGYSTLERLWARPTCDINGLAGGYQGPGAKTVIGAWASAKVSMRLVPNQDPRKVQSAFRAVMRSRAPRGVRVSFTLEDHVAKPVVIPLDTPAVRLAAEAVTGGFGIAPVFTRSGGTIPVVAMLKDTLGLDSLLVGFGLPDDRVHSPNEKFDLECFHAGMRTAALLYQKLAGLPLKS
ncbi:MAG: M20/M25/M40 family metallo-hydrolase, partial [Phycisphaerae bacterium]|nr:M20/M25/M40 family metallo-hydrolase [Phycisphaerae bacterium]